MGIVGKIVCKTVGVAGMSAVLYDAVSRSRAQSKRTSQQFDADFFEKVHADTRTTATESPLTSAMQKKVANWRMNNPIVSMSGKIKGGTSGFLSSLAWGTVGYGLFVVAREGFGLSKKSPID